MSILSRLKSRWVRSGREPRRILTGLFRGLEMELDLRDHTQLFIGSFERETQPWLKKLSAGIATAVDIGAGDGEHTLFFAARTSARVVYVFEPIAECRARIQRNLALNRRREPVQLRVREELVGSREGNGMVTLDSLYTHLEPPCLVKIDVDGAEADILKGAPAILRQGNTRWLIETHSVTLERECLASLAAAGYWTKVVPNAWWRCILPELRSGDQNRWLVAAKDIRL